MIFLEFSPFNEIQKIVSNTITDNTTTVGQGQNADRQNKTQDKTKAKTVSTNKEAAQPKSSLPKYIAIGFSVAALGSGGIYLLFFKTALFLK